MSMESTIEHTGRSRAHLQNNQMRRLVYDFVAVKYPTIPHVVLAADREDTAHLVGMFEKNGSIQWLVPGEGGMRMEWSHFQDHVHWLKEEPSEQYKTRCLVLTNRMMATQGWRTNFQCGISCTYMLSNNDAVQLRHRVSQLGSLNKSPAFVAEFPTLEVL